MDHREVSKVVEALAEAGREVREVCDKLEAREQERITYCCGYEFKNGSYTASDQYKAYRAKVDAIHAQAIALRDKREVK